jgi:membrane protease YdiL (CAAX protease family)
MARRAWLEIISVIVSVALARDLTVALDLWLREQWPDYAKLGAVTINAIWIVVLVALALAWPGTGRPRVRPPEATWTRSNALVLIGVLVAADWTFGFKLLHVVEGQVPLHTPASWLAFAAIAIGGPAVEEWVFRGLLWDAIASRTPGRAASIAPIAITSLLFGVAHCQWMIRPSWFTPSGTLVAWHVAFGACMAMLRWRFRSIGPGVVVHGAWNALYPLTA